MFSKVCYKSLLKDQPWSPRLLPAIFRVSLYETGPVIQSNVSLNEVNDSLSLRVQLNSCVLIFSDKTLAFAFFFFFFFFGGGGGGGGGGKGQNDSGTFR